MPLYEEKLISPLAIRFGQNRIRSTFRDGHTLDESLAQIVPIAPPEGSDHKFLLHTPFPPIEVVRWRPKLRDDDGVALENKSGKALHGAECWFSLDNRRLYCLQRAAANLLPQGAAACVVRITYDIPTVKSIARKFKTTSLGSCVRIDHHRDQAPFLHWEWESLTHVKKLLANGRSKALAQVKKDMETRDLHQLVDAPLMDGTPIAHCGAKAGPKCAEEAENPEEDSTSASDELESSSLDENTCQQTDEEHQETDGEHPEAEEELQEEEEHEQEEAILAQLRHLTWQQQQLLAQQYEAMAAQHIWHMQQSMAQMQYWQQYWQQPMQQPWVQPFATQTRKVRPQARPERHGATRARKAMMAI